MDNNKETLHLKSIDIANIQTSSPCVPTKDNTSHTQLQHSRKPLSFTNNFQHQLQSTAPLSPEIEETKKLIQSLMNDIKKENPSYIGLRYESKTKLAGKPQYRVDLLRQGIHVILSQHHDEHHLFLNFETQHFHVVDNHSKQIKRPCTDSEEQLLIDTYFKSTQDETNKTATVTYIFKPKKLI